MSSCGNFTTGYWEIKVSKTNKVTDLHGSGVEVHVKGQTNFPNHHDKFALVMVAFL